MQALRHAVEFLNERGYPYTLLIAEIVKEETYRLQVACNRLRGSSLPQEMIDIGSDLLTGHLDQRYGKPSDEVIEDVDVALHRVDRVAFSL